MKEECFRKLLTSHPCGINYQEADILNISCQEKGEKDLAINVIKNEEDVKAMLAQSLF